MFASGDFCNFPINDEDSNSTSSDLFRMSFSTSTNSNESSIQSNDVSDFPVCPHAHNFECLDEIHEESQNHSQKDLCDVMFLVGPALHQNYGLRAVMADTSVVLHCLFEKHELLANKGPCDKQKKRNTGCFPKLFKRAKNRNSDRKSQLVIFLPEHDSILFEHFLTFMHTGDVDINISNLAGLMHLADLYKVDDLSKACLNYSDGCVTSQTVIALLTSSQRYSHSGPVWRLINKLLNYIDYHANAVITSREFLKAHPSIATMIVSRTQLALSENDRVAAILSWTKGHHRGNTVDLTVTLNRLLECVNFNRVTNSKLIRDVTDLGYVPPMPVTDHAHLNAPVQLNVRCKLSPSNYHIGNHNFLKAVKSRPLSIESGFKSAT